MAVGNKKIMMHINGRYVKEECSIFAKQHGVSKKWLSQRIGHSASYIQAACADGKMPLAEFELLSLIVGFDKGKAQCETPDTKGSAVKEIDNIIDQLESIKNLLENMKKAAE